MKTRSSSDSDEVAKEEVLGLFQFLLGNVLMVAGMGVQSLVGGSAARNGMPSEAPIDIPQ